MRQHAKPIFLAAMIVIMLVSAALAPLTEWLALGITWIGTHPTMAWFVYVAIYIVATVLAFPASVLTLAAGFVFGLPLALVLASVGSVLGASAAFSFLFAIDPPSKNWRMCDGKGHTQHPCAVRHAIGCYKSRLFDWHLA